MYYRCLDLFYKGFWTTLDWIYPPECASCDEPGFRICKVCEDKITYLEGSFCRRCGEPIRNGLPLCEVCQINLPPYTALRSLAWYDGVIRACIQDLKYNQNQGLGVWFAVRLSALFKAEGWHADFVVPVPLSKLRMKERGYNQAALIARSLAASLQLPYKPYGLIRPVDTRSQVGLSAEQRHQNVAGAFKAEPAVVRDKSILVIDDVMTTGATLNAVSHTLFGVGAKAVYCLTVARFSPKLKHDLA